jgi:hypothetical protein
MQVFVKVKAAGRRRPALAKRPLELPDHLRTLEDLVRAVVAAEARRFNARPADAEVSAGAGEDALFHCLTETEIAAELTTGKISFGRRYGGQDAEIEQAVVTALQGFADGLWRVFRNGEALTELQAAADLKEGDELTFLRLTFLSGRLW